MAQFIKGHEVVGVCPEVLGGLSTPRMSSEIVDGVVRHKNGISVDEEFRRGAERALQIVKENAVELVILQSRSPSCGVDTIYDGSFSKKLINGDGVFAKLLKEQGIPVMDVKSMK